MASSLAVEWATKGVRVNALRYEPRFVSGCFRRDTEKSAPSSPRFSPGYMMTKLTRTILSNNPELKVALASLLSTVFSQADAACQRTWENLTPMGRVWRLICRLASEDVTDQNYRLIDGRTRGSRRG